MSVTLNSKGQITIPKHLRDILGLKKGDRLELLLLRDGSLQLIPVTRAMTELKGIIPRPKQPVSIEAMNEVIKQEASSAFQATSVASESPIQPLHTRD